MSKKKKHQKQVNNELPELGEQVRRPARLSENTMTFDAMFSSALQQMLDVQEDEKTKKADEPLTVELPKRGHSHHEHRHTETPKPMPEVRPSGRFVEGADFDIFAADVPEDDAPFDKITEEPRMFEMERSDPEDDYLSEEDEPYFEETFAAGADDLGSEDVPAAEDDLFVPDETPDEMAFTLGVQPKPQIEPPSAAVLQQNILRMFSDSPASEEKLTMPKENLLEELPQEEALPEHFTVPSAETVPEKDSAPEHFVVPSTKKENRQFDAPRYIFTDDSTTAVDRETTPEVFRFPEQENGEERPAEPEVYAVPDLPEDTERLAEPDVFSVPQLTGEKSSASAPRSLTFTKKEKKPAKSDAAPAKDAPEAEPTREKRRHSLFSRRKAAEPETAPKPETAPEPEQEKPHREIPDISDMDLSQNDTATLLSVIQSLIGSDIQPVRDTAEKSPAADLPQPSAEARKAQQREETAEQRGAAPDLLKKLPDEPTQRFTPHREAAQPAASEKPAVRELPEPNAELKQPAPQEKTPAPPTDFWAEFDELKALVGAPLTEETTQQMPADEDLTELTADETPAEAPAEPKEHKDGWLHRMMQKVAALQTSEDDADDAPQDPSEETEQIATKEELTHIEEPAPAEEAAPVKVPAPSAKDTPEQKPARAGREHRKTNAYSQAVLPEQTKAPAVPQLEPAPQQPEEPVIIPSASVKAERPRQPVRERPVQSEPRTAERPVRRRSAAEPQAIPRPDEVSKKCIKALGTTGTRLLIVGVLEVISLLLTLYGSFGWDFLPQGAESPITAYILLGLLLLSAVMAIDVFKAAVQKLQKLQFTAPMLVLLAVIAVSLDTLQAAPAGRVPFCAAAGLLVMFLLWDKYDGMTGILTTMRVLMGAKTPTGIVEVVDVMKGRVGLSRAEGSVEDFMEKFGQTPPTEKLMQIYVPTAMVLSLIASAIIAAKCGTAFLWTLSLLLLGCIPLIGLLNYSRLFCILAKRLSDSDAALCGWYGAETFGGDHSILAGDNDLFPQKSIKLNGIKVLTKEADRVVGYAAATLKAAGSALYPVFEEELQSRNARRFRVERYRFYEGGIGSEISGDVVLMGTMDFMKRMGVHMQSGMKLKQAVYTSVNGELAAVFAIKFTPKDSVRRGLAAVAENRHFRTIFVTRDFLLTPELISDKYEITLHNTAYPPVKERIRLSEAELKEKGKQGALMADDSFGAFADAAAGGRILKSAVHISMLLTVFNGLVGAVLMAVLAAKNGLDAATALNLLLYQLVWALPTLLLTGWTRRY